MAMAQELEEMPLFPLHAVLFPYAALELNVFEDRYREMVRECSEYERPFGVVLIRPGSEDGEQAETHLIGTAVHIDSLQSLESGGLKVSVKGERRFRVRRLNADGPYPMGLVEPVIESEVESSSQTDELMRRIQDGFRMLVEGAIARSNFNIQITFPNDPVVLSFKVASMLPLENFDKQRLLEMTDTLERLDMLTAIIERHIVEARPAQYHRIGSGQLREWVFPN